MHDISAYEEMAKLSLPEKEKAAVANRISLLMKSFEAVAEAVAGDAEPLVAVLDITNVLREDIAAKLLPRDELLAGAPESSDGYFQVPKTL